MAAASSWSPEPTGSRFRFFPFAPVTLSGGGTTELDGRCWIDHVPVTTDALEIFDASGEALLLIYPLGAQSLSGEQTVVVK